MTQVYLYDTTLRDGAGREGLSFSVEDKLKIAQKLDELGIHYIEGGWPGSNPKDVEFFARAKSIPFRNATLVAFGSTRRAHTAPEDDPNLRALVEAGTTTVTIVGKTWDIHVHKVLETTLEENLAMITDSVRFLKAHGLRVFFDAEHFFDGYKANPDYALQALTAAAQAGVDAICLCDTNGGSLPSQVAEAVQAAMGAVAIPLGIHAHNDGELAVANSLAAVQMGAVQVQGTINGYGERCGNANLCSVIPNLKIKMGISCLGDQQLARLTEVSTFVAEIANISPDSHLPYVGLSAFTHKAGLHAAATVKLEESYQHVAPELVGNRKRFLVSELAGRTNIQELARQLGLDLGNDVRAVLDKVKLMESRGFQYEGAEASFELLVRRSQEGYRPPFELVDYLVMVEKRRRFPSLGNNQEEILADAMVKVQVRGAIMHTAAEGNGPVNALDGALRKSLTAFYPTLEEVTLTDYKARIFEETAGTGAHVRVFISSSFREHRWRTTGSSTNIIEASWLALADSFEYFLTKISPQQKPTSLPP